MVLVVEHKKMEGVWWKYGLALFFLQAVPWLLVGYKFNPALDLKRYLSVGTAELSIFLVAAFLPFVCARLGWRVMMWFSLVGFFVAGLSYFVLLLFEPLRSLPNFATLPPTAYLQFDLLLTLMGILIQFGKYVFRKVYEE